MAKHKRQPDVLFCTCCGAKNKLRETSSSVGKCGECGKEPVEALPLLAAVELWGGDASPCSACGMRNSVFHRYCFACGKKVGT